MMKLATTTNLVALKTDKQWAEHTHFDADELTFTMDNCANVNICNQKDTFTSLEPILFPPGMTTASNKAMP